jgi:hypothetical protein
MIDVHVRVSADPNSSSDARQAAMLALQSIFASCFGANLLSSDNPRAAGLGASLCVFAAVTPMARPEERTIMFGRMIDRANEMRG